MEAVVKELGRLERLGSYDKCVADVDSLLYVLESAQNAVEADPGSAQRLVHELQEQIDSINKKLNTHEKEVYSTIGKFGKAIDKTFRNDKGVSLGPTSDGTHGSRKSSRFAEQIVSSPDAKENIDRAIAMYLIRSGEFGVSSTLVKEANVQVADRLVDEFGHMYEILQGIQNHSLAPAIEWAVSKREELQHQGSNLEFCLHKLQFICYLVDQRNPKLAIEYAQHNLAAFGDRYLADISRLMSAILYVDVVDKSPYREVFTSPSYEQVQTMFASEFCALLGFAPQSPLYLAVTAGTIALPTLSKMEALMRARGAEWTTSQELPVEVDLPDMLQFHSIFVCPVSKQQTTESNPPMMLPCGHILAHDSVRSLGKENSNHLFKCPYCPVKATFNQAQRVYF